MGDTKNKEANTIDTSRGESIFFPTLRIVIMFNSGFRCLSKLAFKCSVKQQRETFVLEFMSFVCVYWLDT